MGAKAPSSPCSRATSGNLLTASACILPRVSKKSRVPFQLNLPRSSPVNVTSERISSILMSSYMRLTCTPSTSAAPSTLFVVAGASGLSSTPSWPDMYSIVLGSPKCSTKRLDIVARDLAAREDSSFPPTPAPTTAAPALAPALAPAPGLKPSLLASVSADACDPANPPFRPGALRKLKLFEVSDPDARDEEPVLLEDAVLMG
mmetsp:Transcript_29831/g.67671  ORF Transcript_29831/g.67671 Transcript_29831/m.67671 type:complete len:203 (+) Transcript_29831:1461-2069(+)